MSNNFEPKEIKKASRYLQSKLELLKIDRLKVQEENVYIVENKKDSMLKRLVRTIFK